MCLNATHFLIIVFDRNFYWKTTLWTCRENSTNMRVAARKLHQNNSQGSTLNDIESVSIIKIFNSFVFFPLFFIWLSSAMLHGIVVLFLTESVKYTVVYLSLFFWLSNIFLLQIKVCNVGLWLITLLIYQNPYSKIKWKNASKTNAAEKEALIQLFRSLSIYRFVFS